MGFKNKLFPFPFKGDRIKDIHLNGDDEPFFGFVIFPYQTKEQLDETMSLFIKTYMLKCHDKFDAISLHQIMAKDTDEKPVIQYLQVENKGKRVKRFAFWSIKVVVPTLEDVIDWNGRAQEIYAEQGTYGSNGLKKPDGENHIKYVLEEIRNSIHFGEDNLPTISKKAAYLWQRICAQQSFNNGNKRTAMLAMLIFLHANGYEFQYKKGLKHELVELSLRIATSLSSDRSNRKIDIDEIEAYILSHVRLNLTNDPWNTLELMQSEE